MRAVDDVILEILTEAVPPLNGAPRVHDSYVPTKRDSNIVTSALPYLVYYSNVGDDSNRRLNGANGRRSVFFQVTYVGDSRKQAKWAGEKARAALADKAITVPGRKAWRVLLDESQRIRRDDDAARADGSPLFYGVDTYSIAITRQPGE
jgi:hypothetical protein